MLFLAFVVNASHTFSVPHIIIYNFSINLYCNKNCYSIHWRNQFGARVEDCRLLPRVLLKISYSRILAYIYRVDNKTRGQYRSIQKTSWDRCAIQRYQNAETKSGWHISLSLKSLGCSSPYSSQLFMNTVGYQFLFLGYYASLTMSQGKVLHVDAQDMDTNCLIATSLPA